MVWGAQICPVHGQTQFQNGHLICPQARHLEKSLGAKGARLSARQTHICLGITRWPLACWAWFVPFVWLVGAPAGAGEFFPHLGWSWAAQVWEISHSSLVWEGKH